MARNWRQGSPVSRPGARSAGFSISVGIVDDAGNLVFLPRGDQCGHITFKTMRGEAVLVAGFRLPASGFAA